MKTYELEITLDDNTTFLDGMDAQTSAQALQLGYWNWECAVHIEIVGVTFTIGSDSL
jgi:hypothetical protein